MKKSVLLIILITFIFINLAQGENEILCEDSDNGLNYYNQGYLTLTNTKNAEYIIELKEKLEIKRITQEQFDEAIDRLRPDIVVDTCGFLEEPSGTFANFVHEGYCVKNGDLSLAINNPNKNNPGEWQTPIKLYDCSKENKLCFDGKCEEPGKEGYDIRLKYDLNKNISSKIKVYGKNIYIKDVFFEEIEGRDFNNIRFYPEFVVDDISIKSSDCTGPICKVNGLTIIFETDIIDSSFQKRFSKDNILPIHLMISPIDNNLKESDANSIIKQVKREKNILYIIYFKLFGNLFRGF